MKRISQHIALHRQGVTESSERETIIAHGIWIARLRELLTETRTIDHDAYVQIRAQSSVFDLIEAEGEAMIEALTVRGTFRREEITLVQKRQT
jgi:hypothetical protein